MPAQGGATVLDYVEPARSHISQTIVSFELYGYINFFLKIMGVQTIEVQPKRVR